MLRLLVPLLVTLTLVAADAAAEARLRSQVTVEGPTITFGHLFEGAGTLADVGVGPAPAPGERAVYTAAQVAAVARAHGLEWRPHNGASTVEVTRAARRVTRPEFIDALRAALQDRGLGSDYTVEIDNRQLAVQAPLGEPVSLTVEALNYQRQSRRFEAMVALSAGSWSERVRLSGSAHRFLELPVLVRPVAAGEVIRAEDLQWTEVRADRLNRRGVTSPDQIVGLAARRSQRPGTPLRLGDFAPPVVVSKGKVVTMTLLAPGMSLTALGRALEDGADGEAILVMNLQSKRTIQAVVSGPDRVRIPHRPQVLVATQGNGRVIQ